MRSQVTNEKLENVQIYTKNKTSLADLTAPDNSVNELLATQFLFASIKHKTRSEYNSKI
jgi:hypothetical protein